MTRRRRLPVATARLARRGPLPVADRSAEPLAVGAEPIWIEASARRSRIAFLLFAGRLFSASKHFQPDSASIMLRSIWSPHDHCRAVPS